MWVLTTGSVARLSADRREAVELSHRDAASVGIQVTGISSRFLKKFCRRSTRNGGSALPCMFAKRSGCENTDLDNSNIDVVVSNLRFRGQANFSMRSARAQKKNWTTVYDGNKTICTSPVVKSLQTFFSVQGSIVVAVSVSLRTLYISNWAMKKTSFIFRHIFVLCFVNLIRNIISNALARCQSVAAEPLAATTSYIFHVTSKMGSGWESSGMKNAVLIHPCEQMVSVHAFPESPSQHRVFHSTNELQEFLFFAQA